MAEQNGANLQHQALRRQNDSSSANFAPYQHFYHPYGYQYNAYPHVINAHQYHQPVPHAHWSYYNSGPHVRPHQSYQPYGQYTYHHQTQYPNRQATQPQHSYHSNNLNSADTLYNQNPVGTDNTSPRVPPMPLLDTKSDQPTVSVVAFSGHRAPFYPPLPWLSRPDESFPQRQPRAKRRPRSQSASEPVKLPTRKHNIADQRPRPSSNDRDITTLSRVSSDEAQNTKDNREIKENERGRNASMLEESLGRPPPSKTAPQAQPIVPVLPVVPRLPTTTRTATTNNANHADCESNTERTVRTSNGEAENLHNTDPSDRSTVAKSPPKTWAELLKGSKSSNGTSSHVRPNFLMPAENGARMQDMLGHAISSFSIDSVHQIPFLEPRGLTNSGNMCYMNSILQALIACVPFYNFLSKVSHSAIYSFRSETPLLDSLIMFMKEFIVIDSADSPDKLRLRLKEVELEQYGEPLLPEYLYEEIRRNPRFATMQRGHQQDAEEFLGFLFEEIQGECERAIRKVSVPISEPEQELKATNEKNDGWLEVGPRQKSSTTRSSGTVEVNTPINMIFGGKLRSELRIPGARNSVTLEPYQSLQLDIGAPDVHTIIDALKGLTKPETLHGDFHSPRGSGATATKQIFVEALPPVLILHLKRFQYDNTGGTQKIWKSIGYPLELEIPRELFPHTKRGSFAAHGGLPRYHLKSVIYHHGKSATAGHYTTDILRQDGKEWLRFDDTVIRRIRREEVELTNEVNSKALANALEQHRREYLETLSASDTQGGEVIDSSMELGWSQAKTNKKWVANSSGTAKSSEVVTPNVQGSMKDNKVAYILFYERSGS